ncbi:hypothetical protein A7U60_g7560 [Sanghuangporus baumii]|uniref:Uncharacterized protein n=1 Tax=Sanghuangporus baumii TaxID=108892 RepID=A0A9Q5HTD0_SANBA|nr:hypothetical protein A7U60_g7560 [Sanghuangporus baumii]
MAEAIQFRFPILYNRKIPGTGFAHIHIQQKYESHYPEEVEFPRTCRDLANPLILNDFYVQVLIQMRTYVLYEKNKMTMILFSALNAIALVFFVVEVTVLSLPKYVNNIETLTAASEIGLHFTYYSPLFWAPFLLNEVVTFLMVFFKFIKVRWSSKGTISSGSNMTLYNVVIRDNMIYFFVIFLVYLSGFVLFINPGIQQTFDGTHMLASIAVSGILAPNLLLMLKKGYYKQEQDAKPATGISTFHATVCRGIETHIADQDG